MSDGESVPPTRSNQIIRKVNDESPPIDTTHLLAISAITPGSSRTAPVAPTTDSDRIAALEAEVADLRKLLDELEEFVVNQAIHGPPPVKFTGRAPHIMTETEMTSAGLTHQGGASTSARYGREELGGLTRKQYAEELGVSVKTVQRWENAGIVNPRTEMVGRVPTRVFSDEDVQLGKLVTQAPGRKTLEDAARWARSQLADQT